MASPGQITISTTDELEGWEIQQYLDTVSAHVVTGTNVFSDVFASFSDIFGGRSKSYQNQLTSIDEQVVDALREEAAGMGADAVIGIRIDHDEVSGSGKSMFMVTASGTAVRARRTREDELPDEDGPDQVPGPEMNRWIKREKLLEKAEADGLRWTDDTWEFFIEDGTEAAREAVLRHVRSFSNLGPPPAKKAKEKASRYFRRLPAPIASEALYGALIDPSEDEDYADLVLAIIEETGTLDYERAAEMLGHEEIDVRRAGLNTLPCEKSTHVPEDLDAIGQVLEALEEGFPELTEHHVNEGMFSETEVWTCICGEENEAEQVRCSACHRDKRGLKRDDPGLKEVRSKLRWRRRALRDLFS